MLPSLLLCITLLAVGFWAVGGFPFFAGSAMPANATDSLGISASGLSSSIASAALSTPHSSSSSSAAASKREWDSLVLNSPCALLLERESGRVLLSRGAKTPVLPASMVKMMTALVAVERLRDLDETVLLPTELFYSLYQENASMAGFLPEEQVAVRDLLYAVMLPSGAEAAAGLALHVAGGEAAFVELMNEKAKELGMTATHYVNASGLDSPELVTTVEDQARLLCYGLNNKTFRTLITTFSYRSMPTLLHPDGLLMNSTLRLHMDTPDFAGGMLLGGKTGYTPGAGQCLASLAEVDGVEYVLVTAHALGDNKTQSLHVRDAFSVYQYLHRLQSSGNSTVDNISNTGERNVSE